MTTRDRRSTKFMTPKYMPSRRTPVASSSASMTSLTTISCTRVMPEFAAPSAANIRIPDSELVANRLPSVRTAKMVTDQMRAFFAPKRRAIRRHSG
jgi:hypothetical protein